MQTIQPSADHPLPFDLTDEQPKTHSDAVATAVNTVDLISELGGSIDFKNEDLAKAQNLITGTQKPNTPKHVSSSAEAAAAHRLIKEFDFQAFSDALQARNFITNKLISLSNIGDPKIEIKALELLGKHSDIGLFTERSEITIHHTSSTALENSIKERIKRLLNSDVTDVPSLMDELDGLPTRNSAKNALENTQYVAAENTSEERVAKTVENEHKGFQDGPIECPVCREKGDPTPKCGCVTYENDQEEEKPNE